MEAKAPKHPPLHAIVATGLMLNLISFQNLSQDFQVHYDLTPLNISPLTAVKILTRQE